MSLDNINIKEIYREFQNELPSRLETSRQLLDVQNLQFNRDEFDKLESIYLDIFAKQVGEQNTVKNISELRSCLVVYAGQAIIQNYGGKWFYETKKYSDCYGKPSIIDWGPGDWIVIDPEKIVKLSEEGHKKMSSIFDDIHRYFKLKGYE